MKKRKTYIDQLTIPFQEIIENLGVPANYDFSKLKKIYLPNNPLTDYPLFLPAKTKAVNNSRVRYRYIFEKKKQGVEPKIDVNDLVYYNGDFTIKADMDYGLPDEFDGQVFDCLIMLISKEYVEKSKVFKGYRIDEMTIMGELVKHGYKPGGSLYNRIKCSLNRMFLTSYVINQEHIGTKGEINYLEILYRLIDGIYRKGKKYMDTDGQYKEFDHTVVLPHQAILSSIEEKKYSIIANEKRYQLKRYMSKVIYDRLHLIVYALIFSQTKDIFVAQKCKTMPFVVIGYKKFCNRVGITPLAEPDMRPGNITKQLNEFINELLEHKIIHCLEMDKKATVEKDYNLVFIFTWEFVDRVFEMANKSMDLQGLDSISKELIENYYKKLEVQIKSQKIKEKIKKGF